MEWVRRVGEEGVYSLRPVRRAGYRGMSGFRLRWCYKINTY